MAKQLGLALEKPAAKTWGGARKGAGRKPSAPRTSGALPHRSRDEHAARWPVHVTLRAREGVPRLRQEEVLRALYGCFRRATARGRRFVHFSLQGNHLHIIMESQGRDALARALKGFASATARAFNRVLRRRGPLWEDRYHRHDLRTPTEVHRALAYVLHNARKHAASALERAKCMTTLDAFSSAAWFDGWDDGGTKRARALEAALAQRGFTRCTAAARTFLLARGFRRLGPIAFTFGFGQEPDSSEHFAAPPGPTSRCSTRPSASA
jgi:REP element-mobilizing transposase RayT